MTFATRRFSILALALAAAGPMTLAGCDGSGSGITGILRTNATLSALAISAGSLSPSFNASTTSYAAVVSNATITTTVTATSATNGATITINGSTVASGSSSAPINLSVGTNTILVVVTNPDGLATRTYTLTVTRSTI